VKKKSVKTQNLEETKDEERMTIRDRAQRRKKQGSGNNLTTKRKGHFASVQPTKRGLQIHHFSKQGGKNKGLQYTAKSSLVDPRYEAGPEALEEGSLKKAGKNARRQGWGAQGLRRSVCKPGKNEGEKGRKNLD